MVSVVVRSTVGILGICAAAGFIVFGAGLDGSAQSATIDPSSMKLTFEENFDHLDVSPWGPGTRWIAHTPWNGDFGDAQFANPTPGFPFTTQDGTLRIEARKGDDGKWQSGLLSSTDPKGAGFSQTYGYFETRARFPPGTGVWPAFWLVNRGEPKAVELDVVEYYGQFPESYIASVHVWDHKTPANSKTYSQKVAVPSGSLTSDFHTYGVSVQQDMLRFYLDRKLVWSIVKPRELDSPFTVLVNLGLGSGWPIDKTPNPSIMEVDYIRVWSFPE